MIMLCVCCPYSMQALNNRVYDPSVFEALRHEDPLRAAATLAAAGQVAGLQLLLQRHRAALHPRLLLLLSGLPETLDPRLFAGLIPRAGVAGTAAVQNAAPGSTANASLVAAALRAVGPGSVHYVGGRKVDWVECEETMQILLAAAAGQFPPLHAAAAAASSSDVGYSTISPNAAAAAATDAADGALVTLLQTARSLDASIYHVNPDDAAAMVHSTEEMERLYLQQQQQQQRNVKLNPSDDEVAEWLATRALQLDATTGQLQASIQLLELAITKGYGTFSVHLDTCIARAAGGCSSNRRQTDSSSNGGSNIEQDSSSSSNNRFVTLQGLLSQAQVLQQLVSSWWPSQQPQQQAADLSMNASSTMHGTAAAAAAAAAALDQIWCVDLVRWVSAGLLTQLFMCLGNSSRDLLEQDLLKR